MSVKKQVLSNTRFSIFTADDRWFVQGDNRLWWTSLDTYELGAAALSAGAENVRFDSSGSTITGVHPAVRPHLFAGLGINVSTHSNILPGNGVSTFDELRYAADNDRHGFGDKRQISGGTSLGLLWDTRDNGINAQCGWLASAAFRTFFDGFLGGDSTWQQLYLDVRTYRKLTADGRQSLALRFLSDNVLNGTALYFDLPAIASDGRFGERFQRRPLSWRAPRGTARCRTAARSTSNGLLGFVTFLNTTTVDNADAGKKLFDDFAPAAGFGFRVLLNKYSRTNLTADYAWGKDGIPGSLTSESRRRSSYLVTRRRRPGRPTTNSGNSRS